MVIITHSMLSWLDLHALIMPSIFRTESSGERLPKVSSVRNARAFSQMVQPWEKKHP